MTPYGYSIRGCFYIPLYGRMTIPLYGRMTIR